MSKRVSYELGAGPYTAERIERDDGTVEIRMFNGVLIGHGNTAREAAIHLAEQIRMIAHFVEGHEGLRVGERSR